MTKADLIEALSKVDRTKILPGPKFEVFPIPDELVIPDENEELDDSDEKDFSGILRNVSMLEAGKRVKYLGESSWAYTKGEIYIVEGYDEELDAWGVRANNDEIYAVGEDDLEEIE